MNDKTQQTDARRLEKEEIEDLGTVTLARGGHVYAAKGGDVAMTMVRGNILYQNGRFPTIDLNTVVEELTTYAIPKLFTKEENDVE